MGARPCTLRNGLGRVKTLPNTGAQHPNESPCLGAGQGLGAGFVKAEGFGRIQATATWSARNKVISQTLRNEREYYRGRVPPRPQDRGADDGARSTGMRPPTEAA